MSRISITSSTISNQRTNQRKKEKNVHSFVNIFIIIILSHGALLSVFDAIALSICFMYYYYYTYISLLKHFLFLSVLCYFRKKRTIQIGYFVSNVNDITFSFHFTFFLLCTRMYTFMCCQCICVYLSLILMPHAVIYIFVGPFSWYPWIMSTSFECIR